MMTWADTGAWWLMPLVMILVGGVLIAIGLLVIRWLAPTTRQDAVSLLEHRYAQGEIDDEEYRRRRRLLTGRDG